MSNRLATDRLGLGAMPPLLICSDLQKGLFDGPGHSSHEAAAPVLRHCRALLGAWRSMRWPIAHLKRIARPAWFDPSSELADWIDDFRPRPGESTFEHALPSAYSSARFVEYMRSVLPTGSVLVGSSLDETILSTAIDGYHRGYHHQIISDAVACKAGVGQTADYREAVLHLLGSYSGRVCSEAVLRLAS